MSGWSFLRISITSICTFIPTADWYDRIVLHIMQTCPCSDDPLTPHFYIVKLGVYMGKHLFLNFALKHRLWVLITIRTK